MKNRHSATPAESFDEFETPDKRPVYLAAGISIGVVVIVVLLVHFNIVFLSTAVYLIGLACIPLTLWLGRKACTLYTVFLGCILAALLTSLYCLWSVLGRYNYDVKAQEAKEKIAMIQPAGDRWLAKIQ